MFRQFSFAVLAVLGSTSLAQAACDPTACPNIVFDGDSISVGVGTPDAHGLVAEVATVSGGSVSLHDVAVGGRPVFQCLALYDQTVSPLYQATNPHNVIVFHAGDNDVAGGRNAEQTYAAFTEYTARAHKQGWKIVVSTEFKRPDFPPPMEQQLELYNQMLLRNTAKADAVVNLDTDPRFGDLAKRSDASIFSPDHIHPSDGGYRVLAAMLAPAVKAVLAKP